MSEPIHHFRSNMAINFWHPPVLPPIEDLWHSLASEQICVLTLPTVPFPQVSAVEMLQSVNTSVDTVSKCIKVDPEFSASNAGKITLEQSLPHSLQGSEVALESCRCNEMTTKHHLFNVSSLNSPVLTDVEMSLGLCNAIFHPTPEPILLPRQPFDGIRPMFSALTLDCTGAPYLECPSSTTDSAMNTVGMHYENAPTAFSPNLLPYSSHWLNGIAPNLSSVYFPQLLNNSSNLGDVSSAFSYPCPSEFVGQNPFATAVDFYYAQLLALNAYNSANTSAYYTEQPSGRPLFTPIPTSPVSSVASPSISVPSRKLFDTDSSSDLLDVVSQAANDQALEAKGLNLTPDNQIQESQTRSPSPCSDSSRLQIVLYNSEDSGVDTEFDVEAKSLDVERQDVELVKLAKLVIVEGHDNSGSDEAQQLVANDKVRGTTPLPDNGIKDTSERHSADSSSKSSAVEVATDSTTELDRQVEPDSTTKTGDPGPKMSLNKKAATCGTDRQNRLGQYSYTLKPDVLEPDPSTGIALKCIGRDKIGLYYVGGTIPLLSSHCLQSTFTKRATRENKTGRSLNVASGRKQPSTDSLSVCDDFTCAPKPKRVKLPEIPLKSTSTVRNCCRDKDVKSYFNGISVYSTLVSGSGHTQCSSVYKRSKRVLVSDKLNDSFENEMSSLDLSVEELRFNSPACTSSPKSVVSGAADSRMQSTTKQQWFAVSELSSNLRSGSFVSRERSSNIPKCLYSKLGEHKGASMFPQCVAVTETNNTDKDHDYVVPTEHKCKEHNSVFHDHDYLTMPVVETQKSSAENIQ